MNLRETLRYLGYRGHKPDEQTLSLIEECWRELEGVPGISTGVFGRREA